VERAARELGFSFRAIGRALQSRRSMTIGCLVPSLANPVFAEAVQGLQDALSGTGYQLLIASSGYDAAADDAAIETLVSKGIDGLIVTMVDPGDSPALARARSRDIPTVLMFHDPVAGIPSAYVDNAEAARTVARECLRHGHRRTGFLALRFASSDRSRNRYAGFLAECRARALPDPVLIELSEAEANTPEKLAALLSEHSDVTAIFASNDFLAIAVQKAARLLGLSVPEHLSVVGFDGIEIGRLLDVPLATVETAPGRMGRRAAEMLTDMLQGRGVDQPPSLPFAFRSGATLAAPCPETRDDDQVAARPSSVPPVQTDPDTEPKRG